MHEFKHEACVPCVGYGYEQSSIGGQEFPAGLQHVLRLAQMLQYVGTDDGVVSLSSEKQGEIDVF